MDNFEIFERIINGELRPHKYESDGKILEDKIENLGITNEEFAKQIKYLEKEGKSYSIKITDPETGDIILDEKRNDEFNELIDIDIPPLPVKEGEKYLDINALNDEKAEMYLDLIEFEYARNLITIDEYFNNNKEKQLKKYATLNIQRLKKLWKDIRHYEKLIIKSDELDWRKSNDYVIHLVKVFLDRVFYYLLEVFRPYIKDSYWEETMNFLKSEMTELMTKILDLKYDLIAKKYKEKTGLDLPCSVSSFELEREEISKLSNINDRLIRYRDYLTFWKGAILSESMLSGDNEIKSRIIPLIENEIENLEYKLSLSTSTENDGKGIVEETETAEDLVDENSRFNLTEEVNEFAYLKDRMKLFPKSTTQNTPFQKSNIYSMIYWLGNKNQLVDLSRKLVEYEFISKKEKKLFIGIFSYSKKQSLSQPREAKDKVQWQDTDTLFTYLFVKLVGSGLLKKDFLYPTGGGWSILTKYFLNKKGNQLNNRQLANTAQNYARNKNMKPKRSENIDSIVDEVAATKKTM